MNVCVFVIFLFHSIHTTHSHQWWPMPRETVTATPTPLLNTDLDLSTKAVPPQNNKGSSDRRQMNENEALINVIQSCDIIFFFSGGKTGKQKLKSPQHKVAQWWWGWEATAWWWHTRWSLLVVSSSAPHTLVSYSEEERKWGMKRKREGNRERESTHSGEGVAGWGGGVRFAWESTNYRSVCVFVCVW